MTEPSQTTTPDSTTTPEPDGKTLLTEGKKPEVKEEKKDGDKPKEATGAPEKYEDYKVPEGYTLDPAVKTEADALFKGLGLNQEQAQSLVDFYTSKTTEAFNAPFKAYQEMTDGWRKEAMDHPDLRGKLGPGLEVSTRIGRALDAIGDKSLTDGFRAMMDLTGAGNNVSFIRVFDRLAQKFTEGTHVSGNGPTKPSQSRPGEGPPSAAAAIWPTLPSQTRG